MKLYQSTQDLSIPVIQFQVFNSILSIFNSKDFIFNSIYFMPFPFSYFIPGFQLSRLGQI
jgi:hypothetical protein